ncbi:MAG: type II secretion system protein GspC [Pseudomonadota bacterium]|nr:type II secretion system protein GspC [Pseudomonadota bacterium]
MSDTISLQRAAQVYERYGRHLPQLSSLLLVIVIAWLLATLVWVVMPLPETARWQPPPAVAAKARNKQAGNAVDSLIAARMFGEAAPLGTDGKPAEAPDTRLNLTLLGILAGGEKDSRALIAPDNGEEKPFAIGDTVVSGTKLEAIFPERVILLRGGKYETLRLNKEAPSTATTYNPAAAAPAASADTTAMLGKIRDEIMADPTKASNYMRVQPAKVGDQLKGYRVYPGREREMFKELGLRPGDLVTSVNGIQLDDTQKALQLLSDLGQANAVSLTIERGGQVQNLNLSLN